MRSYLEVLSIIVLGLLTKQWASGVSRPKKFKIHFFPEFIQRRRQGEGGKDEGRRRKDEIRWRVWSVP